MGLLFQDAAGLIPSVVAGSPVGLLKRSGGSVDAVQATALSKPTLARRPKGGWKVAQSQNSWHDFPLGQTTTVFKNGLLVRGTEYGVTVEILERGIEGGLPYIVIKYSGSNTNSSTSFLNIINDNAVPVPTTGEITIGSYIQLLSGTIFSKDNDGATLLMYANFKAADGTTVNGIAGRKDVTSVETYFSQICPIPPTATTVTNRGMYVRLGAGQTIDLTIKVKALQSYIGPKTSYQVAYGPNDITEPGVADLWHLYNDGGDSLNVTLPAGTYGLASIDINRAVKFETLVHDGVSPINTLRNERQVDFEIKPLAFNDAEQRRITQYWMEKYP